MGFLLKFVPVEYQWLAKLIGAAILLLAMWYAWHQFTGHYIDIGKAEVQAKWDKDTEKRKAESDRQRAESRQKEADAKAAVNQAMQDHNTEITKIRSESNAHIQSSVADTDAAWRNRLRDAIAADRARSVSELSSAAVEPAKSGGDGDAAVTEWERKYDILEDACKVTTSDYNALWNSWDKACAVTGCR